MADRSRGSRRAKPGLLECLEPRIALARGDLLVTFGTLVTQPAIARVLGRVGLEQVERFDDGLVLARLDQGRPAAQLPRIEARLRQSVGVKRVERDHQMVDPSAARALTVPLGQWGLDSANNIDIDATRGWSITTGSSRTIVAVIDSGLDFSRPEFAGRLWVNPREIPGNNKDDDRDGYVDDVNGWNFVSDTNDVSDDLGHGTHVAGIIAATAQPGAPVVGVDQRAKIMPLKFLDADGSGYVSDAVRAVQFAVRNGARVINASWSSTEYSASLASAIQYAGNRGVVFVTAAGNDSLNLDTRRSYPASLHLPNMITVAAIDSSGKLAGFSNYGRKSVDLVAPGVSILSTVPGGYAYYSGTSMAAPYVTGVVSLLIGQQPRWTAKQVVDRIKGTTKPLASVSSKTITGGIVDAAQALDSRVKVAAKQATSTAKKKTPARPAAHRPARSHARSIAFHARGWNAVPASGS